MGEEICIVRKCVTEAVIRQVREASRGYYSFYIAVLIFYLLTLAEGIDFIKDISTAWYVRLRLILGVFALGEVAAFVIALIGSFGANGACPQDLDYNNPPVKTYNDLTLGSTAVRCVAILVYMICYVLARCNPDAPTEGDESTQAEAKKASSSV